MAEDDQNLNEEGQERSQAEVASELNSVLAQISAKMEKINESAKTQADFINSIVESFDKINSFTEDMIENSNKINEALNETVEKVHENLSKKNFDDINEGLDEVAKKAQSTVSTHTESLEKVGKTVKNTGNTTEQVNKTYTKSSNKLTKSININSKSLTRFYDSANYANKELQTFTEELKETSEKMGDVTSGYLGAIQKYAGAIMKGGLILINFVTGAIGNMVRFAKFAVTLPFTVAKLAASAGGKLREQIAQIKEAGEELKKTFDFESSVGRGIQSLVSRGTGMLKAFQSPSNELVRIFGLGVSGITNLISFLGENIGAMEQFSEIFGESILKNDDRMKNFIRLVKGLGFSAEDIKYISLDASNNLKHVNVRMAEIAETLSITSKEFGVDRKRLSKNFMLLRKDIVQFGHLSDEEISRTAARLTQMRVKLEDATAVFKKFSTFEDAANSVAMLSQTFGMNLDAMDIIKAKNPEEIIEMFRNSMLETGRSYQDLNRFEKEIMAQHTGISEQSLSALMNYRDLGLTYEQAKKRMESEQPEAKQMKAIKKLNSAIKEFQKVLNFNSPFEAFFRGMLNNINLSGDLKKTLISLSSGYQGIYEFALKLDPNTWIGLVRPIKMIIDIMSNIMQSKAFKDGLVGTLKSVSNFVADIFGASSSDTVLSKIETNVRMQMGKKGKLYDSAANKKNRKDFVDTIMAGVKQRNNLLGSLVDIKELEKISDPLDLIRKLQDLKGEIGPNDPKRMKLFDDMMQKVSAELLKKYYPKSQIKKGGKAADALPDAVSPAENLAAGLKDSIESNSDNLGILFDLSMKVAGAIVKGGIIGGTAILRVINSQIDKAGKKAQTSGSTKKNAFEELLGFDQGEFNKLGDSINAAFIEFLEKTKQNSGIFGWFAKGISDLTGLMMNMFVSALKGAFKSLLGFANEKSVSETYKEQSSGFAVKPTAAETINKVQQTEIEDKQSYFGVEQDRTTAINLITDFVESEKKYKGTSTAKSDYNTLINIIETRLQNDALNSGELSDIAQNIAKIQKNIVLGNNVDAQISDFLKKIQAFDKEKKRKKGIDKKAQSVLGYSEKFVDAFNFASDAVGEQSRKAGKNMIDFNKSFFGSALGMLIYGGGSALQGVGRATSFTYDVIVNDLMINAFRSGLNSDIDVEDLQDGRIAANQDSTDMIFKKNVYAGTANYKEVKFELEKEKRRIQATYNAKDQFAERLKIETPRENRITREQYATFVETFKKIKEEAAQTLNVEANMIVNEDLVYYVWDKGVKKNHHSMMLDSSKTQGGIAFTEDVIVSTCFNPGARNSAASPFYGNEQRLDRSS